MKTLADSRRRGHSCGTISAWLRAVCTVVLLTARLPCAGAFQLDLKPGEWRELPGTSLQSVAPKSEGHPAWGTMGPRAVTDAWGGAAYDPKRNVLVLTGGGHNDYGGNEVYEFHLRTLKWVRATEPSPMLDIGNGRFQVLGSQAPVSSHTYDGLVYLPNLDRIFKYGGSYYRGGTAYDRHAYLYSIADKSWKRAAEAPITLVQVVSDFDPKTARVIVGTGSGLMFYSTTEDKWTVASRSNSQLFAVAGVLDPETRLFVQIIEGNGAIEYFKLDEPAVRHKTKIAGPQEWGPRAGAAFDNRSKQMVIWAGGREVWRVRTSDWSVTKIVPAGTAPTGTLQNGTPRTAGIYSRWQYVPDLDCFIGYQHFADNVWLFKLPAERASIELERSARARQ
jgi:hypothetical protein